MKNKVVATAISLTMIFAVWTLAAHANTSETCRDGAMHCQENKMHASCACENERTYVKVGRPAPDFKLEGVVGTEKGKEFKTISLKDYKDKWLVLLFYPADFTLICPTEIKGFNDKIESFRKLNSEVVAASTDSKWSHLAWIKRGDLGNLQYPLLADFNKEIASAYGVLNKEKGVALRALFIIDPKGSIQYQVVHNLDIGRSVEETLRVLEALQSGSQCPLEWKPGQKTIGK